MGNETMIVECNMCKTCFEMPLSNIKKIDDWGNPDLKNKFKCIHCGKRHNGYIDPNKDTEAIEAERQVQYEEEMARKAAEPVSCPRCKSQQFTVSRKFSIGKAILGSVAIGDIGAIAGIGGGKVQCICLKCGEKFSPVK